MLLERHSWTCTTLNNYTIIRRHRISDSAYCDRCICAWSVCLSVCLSHSCTPLKPLDEMRCHLAGTLVWHPSNIVLDGLSGLPTGRGCLGSQPPIAAISQPPPTVNIFISYRQMSASMPPIAKLLWPLLYEFNVENLTRTSGVLWTESSCEAVRTTTKRCVLTTLYWLIYIQQHFKHYRQLSK